MTPTELAQQRLAAIAELEAQVATAAEGAQRELFERLLAQLKDIQADPTTLYALLAEYQRTVLVPLAYTYGQAMLHLPQLNVSYFQALDVAGYQALKAPLTSFLSARLGVDAAGAIVPGGYLDLMAGTGLQRALLTYAYSTQATGIGLSAYRDGLRQLVTGGDKPAEGLVRSMYAEAQEAFSQSDRAIQAIAAKKLGLTAFLYMGGVIATSRPFCVARNGKVFLDSEVEKFGTKADKYLGYTNKAEGLFSGKTSPYSAFVDLGGYGCKHSLSAISNTIALKMRPDLKEDSDTKRLVVV